MNTIIHAAIRSDLGRFVAALASFPDGSAARVAQLSTAWENSRHQLEHHHHSEETLFWPALREMGADESLVNDLGGEHQRMIAALGSADLAMRELASTPSAANAGAAHDAVAQLRDTVGSHFEHEQRDLEPLLLSKVESAPIKRASKQVERSQSPKAGGGFLAWLLDRAAEQDRAALTSTIPKPILFVFGKLLGRSYQRSIAPVWAG